MFLEYIWSTEDAKCSCQRDVHLVIISRLWGSDVRQQRDRESKETGEGGKEEEPEEKIEDKSWRKRRMKKEKRKRWKCRLSPGNLCISLQVFWIKVGVEIQTEPSAWMGGTAPSLDVKELAGYTLPDMLCLHTIDDGVEYWWNHHKKTSQQVMDMSSNVMSKAMGQ